MLKMRTKRTNFCLKTVKFRKVFKGSPNEAFRAAWDAEEWLRQHGYSYGSTDGSRYQPIQKGEYTLPQKLYNFSNEDKAQLAGVISAFDFRHGDVEILLYDKPEYILDLVLKHKWYDMIDSGEKGEEYRELKQYYARRILECYGWYDWCRTGCKGCSVRHNNLSKVTHVRFHRGYTSTTMTFEIKGLSIGKGNPEWGAPDHETFIIKLGKKL